MCSPIKKKKASFKPGKHVARHLMAHKYSSPRLVAFSGCSVRPMKDPRRGPCSPMDPLCAFHNHPRPLIFSLPGCQYNSRAGKAPALGNRGEHKRRAISGKSNRERFVDRLRTRNGNYLAVISPGVTWVPFHPNSLLYSSRQAEAWLLVVGSLTTSISVSTHSESRSGGRCLVIRKSEILVSNWCLLGLCQFGFEKHQRSPLSKLLAGP